MGRIINLNTWEEGLPDALTETGRGGFLSRGYLADAPAIDRVADAEMVQFVLTNRKRGVTVESPESTSAVKPDGRHRTVVVVTDRRLLVLVGREAGDDETSISFDTVSGVEVDAGRRTGRLTVERADGTTWAIPTAADGLDAVGAYLRDAADAWRHVEELLATVEEDLSTAGELRAAGEHERALSLARGTFDAIEEARSTAIRFSTEYPGNALHSRPQDVESQRRATVATIRVAQARESTATGDALFDEGNYEAAREAYERARDEYDSALTVEEQALEDPDRMLAEREHVDALIAEIRDSPLRKAITADRAAVSAEEAETAAAHWKSALGHYRAALDSGGGGLFKTDPEHLRERIQTVAESLTAAQRSVAESAMRAGDWYADAEQHEAALEEFAAAADAFEAAMSTARERYPDAVAHLEADAAALDRRVELAEAALAGEEPSADRIESADEPDYGVTATLGDVDGPTAIEAAIEPPTADAPLEDAGESIADRLRVLDADALGRVVGDALDGRDWSTSVGTPRMPFDLIATRDDERMGVVVQTAAEPVTPADVAACADVTGAAGTDAVMLATAGSASGNVEERAGELGVRLLASESLAELVDGANDSPGDAAWDALAPDG